MCVTLCPFVFLCRGRNLLTYFEEKLTHWRRSDFAITCISHRPPARVYSGLVFNGLMEIYQRWKRATNPGIVRSAGKGQLHDVQNLLRTRKALVYDIPPIFVTSSFNFINFQFSFVRRSLLPLNPRFNFVKLFYLLCCDIFTRYLFSLSYNHTQTTKICVFMYD